MKIEPFELDLTEPLQTAHGEIETRRGFVVRLEQGGIEGVGEATPLPGFTEPEDVCRQTLTKAAARAAEDGIPSALQHIDAERSPAAAHGLALASLDAGARRLEKPLYRTLGGPQRRSIPVNATIGNADVEATVEAALEATERGFDCLKVKVGQRPPAVDVRRLRDVRTAVGPNVALRADVNGAWDLETAETVAAELSDAGVDLAYLEQPLAPDQLTAMATLRETIPVAVDETLIAHSLRSVLEANAADAVVLKPMVHGSPAISRQLGERALDAGLQVIVTSTIDAVVARTAAVHLAASFPSVLPAGLATAALLADDLGPDPAPVTDGEILVPEGPGLGTHARRDG